MPSHGRDLDAAELFSFPGGDCYVTETVKRYPHQPQTPADPRQPFRQDGMHLLPRSMLIDQGLYDSN
jgi:hypothetical protein